jgi:hypothetical protein
MTWQSKLQHDLKKDHYAQQLNKMGDNSKSTTAEIDKQAKQELVDLKSLQQQG